MAEANLPIDSKSLPSRIFYSEDEYKLYVGKPGEYFEIGIGDFIPVSEKAEPNGVATLDGGGKIPATQLPNSVMTLEGEWNADTNTPTLTNGTGNPGMVYEVTTAGATDFGDGDITFAVGDWAVYGADGKWYKSLNSNEVTSVNGKTGTVVLTQQDILPSETGKFLVGGASDWEKRGLRGEDFNMSSPTANRIILWNGTGAGSWVSNGVQMRSDAGSNSVAQRKPSGGALEVGQATTDNDAVPLGQLNTILGDSLEDYLPLAGSSTGKTMTGGIEFYNPAYISLFFGNGSDYTDTTKSSVIGTDFNNNQMWLSPSFGTLSNTFLFLRDNEFNINMAASGYGLTGNNYYGAQYSNNSFIQKKYVDDNFLLNPTEGTSGQVLTTDGSGGRSWTTPPIGITALTGDVTASGSGSVVATIADDAVTPEKLSEKDYVRFAEAGVNWTSASAVQTNQWRGVTYGDDKFVAVSLNGSKVMYSTDGITWTTVSAGVALMQSVTYGNGKFVAVTSNAGAPVMYSTDGITWTSVSDAPSNTWNSIIYGNGKFVAVGTNSAMYSSDGITWTSASATEANTWRSVTYSNDKFVAVSHNGTNRVMYSYDGINWTSASATEANSWRAVTYGNGKFVAVSANGTNRVMYSTDGITWTSASASEDSAWSSITYGGGKFVAVASSGTNRVMYSSDGITWTSASATEANSWQSVTYGNGKFVAVAIDGTNRAMYYSFGGLNFDIPTSALINDGDGTAGPFLSDPLGGTSGQVLTTDGLGGVSWQDASGGSEYVLPTATATTIGGIELFSDTVQSVAASAVTSTASRTYGIQLNSAGQAVVNVPWTNTTYSVMSEAELNAGTASTARTISAQRLKTWLDTFNYVPYSDVTDIPIADKVVQYSDTGNVNTNTATLPNNAVPLSQLNSELGSVVRLTGNQTVAGVKTFSSSPIVPTATTPTQATNLGQVNGLVSGAIQDLQMVIETGSVAITDNHVSIKSSNSIDLLSESSMSIATVGEEGSVAITSPYLILNNNVFPVGTGTPNQVLTTNGAGGLSWTTVSDIKEVDSNYTILDTDRGKTVYILGNNRVITLPNTLTNKFQITIKVMGTGATLEDANGIIVGIPSEYTSPYDVPQFGVICLTKITSGIDLTGDVL